MRSEKNRELLQLPSSRAATWKQNDGEEGQGDGKKNYGYETKDGRLKGAVTKSIFRLEEINIRGGENQSTNFCQCNESTKNCIYLSGANKL